MGMRNLRKHEVLGVLYHFLGATCIGLGIYYAVWAATRNIVNRTLTMPQGWEWLAFPILFGFGAVLWTFGSIEVKEAQPGYGFRRK